MQRILSQTKLLLALVLLSTFVVAKSGHSGRGSYVLSGTAYTSTVRQTDRSPHITATGARTKLGVVALSRDMLRYIPYGSVITIQDYGSSRGKFNSFLASRQFVVEDTMHRRMQNKIDVWLPDYGTAIRFGKRTLKVTVVRYGRG
jgi:3D (Asp-Asp-Asp) domain-containing protein